MLVGLFDILSLVCQFQVRPIYSRNNELAGNLFLDIAGWFDAGCVITYVYMCVIM